MNKLKESGYSILELLIAGALGTIILAVLITIYSAIKASTNRQQFLLDLQDSGRYAQTVLNQRLRSAGFIGCTNPANPVDLSQGIIGYSSQNLPSQLQGQVVAGTDAVVVYSCQSNSQIAADASLVSMAYFIGDTGRLNQSGQPILALFQKPLDGDRLELVAGVEQMQIMYGVAANPATDILAYYSAAQMTNWQIVRSVQIDLLLNSVDPALTQPQTYYFQGQTVLPKDLLLHLPWSTYIRLREF